MCPAPPGNERECGAVKARASAAVDGCVVRVSMTESVVDDKRLGSEVTCIL